MKHRYYLISVLIASVLGWVENSHGNTLTHDQGTAETITQRLPNGNISGFSKAPPDVQFPGLVRVKMSRENGVQIGSHRFKPMNGSLRFTLVNGVPELLARELERAGKKFPEARFYYHVVESDEKGEKESLVDAVNGQLIDPRTGAAVQAVLPTP